MKSIAKGKAKDVAKEVRSTLARSPNRLLNAVGEYLEVARDAGLARELGVSHGALTRVRSGEIEVTPRLILRIYDRTGWSIERIRGMAGISEIESSYERNTGK